MPEEIEPRFSAGLGTRRAHPYSPRWEYVLNILTRHKKNTQWLADQTGLARTSMYAWFRGVISPMCWRVEAICTALATLENTQMDHLEALVFLSNFPKATKVQRMKWKYGGHAKPSARWQYILDILKQYNLTVVQFGALVPNIPSESLMSVFYKNRDTSLARIQNICFQLELINGVPWKTHFSNLMKLEM